MIQWWVVLEGKEVSLDWKKSLLLVLVLVACDHRAMILASMRRPAPNKERIDPKLSVRKSAQHVLFLPAHKPSSASSLQGNAQ